MSQREGITATGSNRKKNNPWGVRQFIKKTRRPLRELFEELRKKIVEAAARLQANLCNLATTSAAQPAFQPEDAEETYFLKSFAFRRPDGEPQRLGVKRLRRYVDNVPPKGSKEGQTFQQIKEYCKTAWHDMQTDGIWAEEFWAFDSLEPHELIAIHYVGL